MSLLSDIKKMRHFDKWSLPYLMLVGFLVLVFLTGGGSRSDIQSLIILRPAALLLLAYGIWGLTAGHVREHRFLFAMALACLCLTALHLFPLPPTLWHSLQGRGLLVETDVLVGNQLVWRPLTMVPSATWNALFALVVPCAVLTLAVQLDRERQFRLLSVLLGLGFISGLLGLMQSIGPTNGALYFYRITNEGLAVGLFANRNHHAVFLSCMFPMLAVYASPGERSSQKSSQKKGLRQWLSLTVAAMLIPLILVTGSRVGLITGAIGLLSVLWLYRFPESGGRPRRKTKNAGRLWYYLGVGGVAILVLTTALAARAKVFDRLFASEKADELRFRMWGPIAEMAEKYLPFGSGIGSFVEVYQIDESLDLLQPEFVPHAHNDWLEVFLTAGLPGVVLLVASVIGYVVAARRSFRAKKQDSTDVLFGRLGVTIIALLGFASVADYPLRTPSLVSFFVVVAIWTANASRRLSKSAGDA